MGLTVTDMGLLKKEKGHELKKHAATIHCSNALSLLQRKISNALLYHAYKELMIKEEHEISVKQLCTLISYHGNNHAAIKEALKGLLSTVIEWNVVSDTTGVEDWTASSILASVSLQGPLCYYAYSPRMKQLLHSPSMFGKINLFIQSRFKSSYGLALYENCIRYRGLPFTKWFEIDIFRKLMGVPSDTYTVFRDFKRRVLDKAVEEVNTYSDLIVEAEVCREGRAVTKVRFGLKERAKKTRLGTVTSIPENLPDDFAMTLMNRFGLSKEQIDELLKRYDRDFIKEKMELIESSKNYQRGHIHNLAGYFLSALKNNYQIVKENRSRVAELDTRIQKSEQTRIRKKYATYREGILDKAIEDLPPAQKQAFLERFHEHAALSINTVLRLQRKKYTMDNVLTSPQIKGLLRQFAEESFPEFKTLPCSLETFMEKCAETLTKDNAILKRVNEKAFE